MKFTEKQLNDPNWWEENAPEGAQAVLDRIHWTKWEDGQEFDYYVGQWVEEYDSRSLDAYENSPDWIVHERPTVGVRGYKCFQQVADVIGEDRAVYELGRVKVIHYDTGLGSAFVWSKSPQGHAFWRCIAKGVSPYADDTESTVDTPVNLEDSHEALTFGPIEEPKKDMKFDGGKPRMNLLPADALLAVAEVLTFGAQKYEADSWKQVEGGRERYEAALLRHWAAFKSGEDYDSETGLSHWAHIACNALFLVHLHSKGSKNE